MLINPITSFLTIMTFLYLFYFQGRMTMKNQNNMTPVSKRAKLGERSERNTKDLNEILRGDFKDSKFFNPLLEEDSQLPTLDQENQFEPES